MRRLTVILMCAVCAVMNVAAQTVASSPTAVSALKSGYYVLKMKSDKTDADGSFVYRKGSNVMFDAKGAAHDLTGKTVDDVSYVFYVADNGGQLTIKAFDKNNYFWPAIPAPKNNDEECNPGQQSKIALAASGQSFTAVASADGWSYLKTSAAKCVKRDGLGGDIKQKTWMSMWLPTVTTYWVIGTPVPARPTMRSSSFMPLTICTTPQMWFRSTMNSVGRAKSRSLKPFLQPLQAVPFRRPLAFLNTLKPPCRRARWKLAMTDRLSRLTAFPLCLSD